MNAETALVAYVRAQVVGTFNLALRIIVLGEIKSDHAKPCEEYDDRIARLILPLGSGLA